MKTQFPTFEIEIVEVSLSFFDRVALTAKMYRIFWAASTSIPLFSHKKIIIFHLFLPLPNTAAFAWLPGCLHCINCGECNFTRFTFTQKEFLQIIIKSLQNAHFGSRQARGDNEFWWKKNRKWSVCTYLVLYLFVAYKIIDKAQIIWKVEDSSYDY